MRMTSGTGAPRPHRPWQAGPAWALWSLVMLTLAAVAWLDLLLRRAGRPELATTAGAVPAVLACLSATTVGAVLATRRPRHPVGWLLLAGGLALALSGVAAEYAPYGLLVRPGELPAARIVALSYPVTALAALTCVGFVLLLTPTGVLPSPRWRWWALVTVAAPVVVVLTMVLAPRPDRPFQVLDNPFDFRALDGALLVVNQAALTVTNVAVVIAAASLVVRFRRASGVERQQLRWVAFAAALMAVAAVAIVAALAVGAEAVLGWAAGLCLAVLPVAIGAAILRYRLYDLDRIISRTVGYGVLTVLLGAGYGVIVLGFGHLFSSRSNLLVAGATLAVAAAFQPARRRVQQAVDRRFDRRRYDAARTIQGFSGKLRHQIDLDTLSEELLAVVEQTMQPARVALWLRPLAGSPDADARDRVRPPARAPGPRPARHRRA